MTEARRLWVPSNDPQRPPMERKRLDNEAT
jgi:hypothetical protein